MKNFGITIFIILGLVLLIVYFDIPSLIQESPKELTAEDSLTIAIQDSINQVRLDSIAAAKAHANRPWKLGSFIDDFGDKTGSQFIATDVDGTFSNSATRDSYLIVRILVTKENAGIFLREYESTRPLVKFIGPGTIMLRNLNNETISIRTIDSWNQSGGLLINDFISGNTVIRSDFSELRNFLIKSQGEVRVVIRDEYSSVYNFTIDATGFTAEYNLL